MWRWLSVMLLLWGNVSSALPTAFGPLSEEESAVLWREGTLSLETKKYSDAVNLLQRIVDRYPEHPHYFESHLLLGQALVSLHRPQDALRPLQFFLSSKRHDLNAIQALLLLSSAYFDLKRYSESHLALLEIERITAPGTKPPLKIPEAERLRTLILKAHVLFELKQISSAVDALNTAKNQLTAQTSPDLQGQVSLLQLQLKLYSCRSPQKLDPLNENQMKGYFDQVGTCYLEALLDYYEVLKIGDTPSAQKATQQLTQDLRLFGRKCTHPIESFPISSRKKRSPRELKQYQLELADEISQQCQKKMGPALTLVHSWKGLKTSTITQEVALALKTFTLRNP